MDALGGVAGVDLRKQRAVLNAVFPDVEDEQQGFTRQEGGAAEQLGLFSVQCQRAQGQGGVP